MSNDESTSLLGILELEYKEHIKSRNVSDKKSFYELEERIQEVEAMIMAELFKLDQPVKKKRKMKKSNKNVFTHPDTGEEHVFTYHFGKWYMCYLKNPLPEDERWLQLFRLRFRLPYREFLLLAEELIGNPMFDQWKSIKCIFARGTSVPIELFLL